MRGYLMKKQIIIAAAAVFSSLSMQGMFVSKIRNIRTARKPAPARIRTYNDILRKQEQVDRKIADMAAEHGIGMRFFVDQLRASNPDSMYAYLEYVNANAKAQNRKIKSFDEFINAFTNPTETQQQEVACD